MPDVISTERSSEVHEIVGKVPPWIIRWGITCILFILIMGLWVSWFIKYPDVVKGSALITTKVAPIELVAKVSGELKILVSDNQAVNKDTPLAYIASSADPNDVLELEESLQANQIANLNSNLSLGDIQRAYSRFALAHTRWNEQQESDPQLKEINHLEKQVQSLLRLNQNTEDQLRVFSREMNLLREKYQTDSVLFSQAVISEIEYKNRTTSFLQQQRAFKNQSAILFNNEYQIEELKKQISRLQVDDRNTRSNLRRDLDNSLSELKTSINEWKKQFLLCAPMKGKVSFHNFFEDGQFIQVGTSVLSVIPRNNEFYAQVNLPIRSSGKVQIGQEVNIRLDNFPSHEFGMVKGVVKKISDLPSDGLLEDQLAYTVLVNLPEGLKTTYRIDLPEQQFLTGQMEVITKDKRILERVFGWIRAKTDN